MAQPRLSDLEYDTPNMGEVDAHKRELRKTVQRAKSYPTNPLWWVMNPHVVVADILMIAYNLFGWMKGDSSK